MLFTALGVTTAQKAGEEMKGEEKREKGEEKREKGEKRKGEKEREGWREKE